MYWPNIHGGFMTFTRIPKNRQQLFLDISNLNLSVTPEQFEQLCLDNPGTKLKLSKDGQVIPQSLATVEEDSDIIHTFNHQGEPFTYNVKDLYWNPQAYEYLKEQEKLFNQCLPVLIEEYAGQYIVFEDNHVIDSDDNEDILLSRIANNELYDDKPAILCILVPTSLVVNEVNA
jgi:Family of unknown function (DUF5678)